MFFDFSWAINFKLNLYSNFKTLFVLRAPVSEKQRLKLYQKRYDTTKNVLYHRQQKK